ncbi:MAG: two pore domain potassium channel family protein [Ruminococcus sp.]|nr:two pore domain potassium channel family protein [Ruminococcus sp.]
MRPIKRMIRILNRTGAVKVFIAYIIVLCIGAVLVTLFEPGIRHIGDGFWFCFVSSTTIGFGDFYAVTVLGRIVIILITIFGILTVAVVPGVIVSYYTEYLHIKEKETVSTFLEKLEHLPELPKEELEELSKKVKEFNKKK